MTQSGRWRCCLLAGASLIASAAIAQEPTSDLAQVQGVVESILAREEAASERPFDVAFRAKAKELLATLPLAELLVQTGETGLGLSSLGDTQADLVYTPVTPCRIIDTRLAGGKIAAGATRSFKVTGDTTSQGGANCGIPFGPATSAMINFVAVEPTAPGDLRITPYGTAIPLAAILNWASGVPGLNLANGLAVALCNPATTTCTNDFTLQADASAIHIVADVQGYFRKTPALFVNTPLGITALGDGALGANTTGSNNAAFGSMSLFSNTTGAYNTGVGAWAGHEVTTGSYNTFVGYQAGPDPGSPAISHATAIGANALATQNNTMVLGGVLGSGDEVNVGIGTTTPDKRLQVMGDVRVGASGRLGCLLNFDGSQTWGICPSDVRLKRDIAAFPPVLDRVAQLTPVRFTWRGNEFPERHLGTARASGLIAQDVERVFPDLVDTDEQGFKVMNYAELPYLTLAAVKELKAKGDELAAQNDALKAQVEALRAEVRRLAAMVEKR